MMLAHTFQSVDYNPVNPDGTITANNKNNTKLKYN
jgi:hypothetical protein